MKNSYIIRIYEQDLCSDWVYTGGVGRPNNYINQEGLVKDLKDNGLSIIKYVFSHFGDCYFFEVEGIYTGIITIDHLSTTSSSFDWSL